VLFGSMERRLVRRGNLPTNAPWRTLGIIDIGGLVLIAALQFVLEQIVMISLAMSGSATAIISLLVSYVFSFLRLAIIARVLSSWVGGGPYSKWWRWSYVSTEWLLGPLRRVIPTFGPIDISPLVAYFGLGLLQNLIVGIIR
jgi:YggT family protein